MLPIIIITYKTSPISPLLFIIGFYTMLVGSKIVLAYTAQKSRYLVGPRYVDIMRILGLFLGLFSFYLIYEGIGLIFK